MLTLQYLLFAFFFSNEIVSVASDVQPLSAYSAPEWDALFDRTWGWTGADGVYSIPLNGIDQQGSGANTTTLFVFSDTFIGNVSANNSRINAALVHNTNALLNGIQPDPNKIQFYWKLSGSGQPQPVVTPSTSTLWFWPIDGYAKSGKIVYLFCLRMKPVTGGFGFDYDGISLLTANANISPLFKTYNQYIAPLYQAATGTLGTIIFGTAIMPNTAAAGAPNPDGYLYVYGLRNDVGTKNLLVSRVKPKDIQNFTEYKFWNGSQWTPSISNAAPVTNRMSSEFSVSPLADGRYLLVFHLDDFLFNTIAVRYGASPVGPWSTEIHIWNPPENQITPNCYTYGAKAHPHLSQPGELLISYHVNTFQFIEHFSNADIYRPRFIKLPL